MPSAPVKSNGDALLSTPARTLPTNMKTTRSMIAGTAVAALLLGACMDKDPRSQIASARAYLAQNDTKAATIEIKSALQANPDLGEGRFLLGTVLMSEGNPAAAEVELRKALSLNFDPDQVIPQLAQAMLKQGQVKKLSDEFGSRRLARPASNADFLTTLYTAWSAQGKTEEANAALTAALAADPSYPLAVLASARQLASKRDFTGAMALADQVLAKSPTHPDAWKLKGDLLLIADPKSDQPLEAYGKAIASDARFLPAHFALLTVQLQRANLDDAARQLEQTRKVAPQHLQTKFFEAQLAYYRKDFKTARDLAQQLVRAAPNVPGILQLAGAIELQMNSLVQAEIYLTRALQTAPGLALARQLLVTTQLRSGQPAKALETLNASATKDGIDPALYSVAGDVYLLNGNAKKAEEYFAKALKLDPANARKRTAVAMTHLATGQTESALEDLQAIASSDSGTTADLALIATHLRRKQYDQALASIDRLEAKQPDKPFASNLRGRVQLTQRDLSGARKSFERALTIDPAYYPAAAGLAALDVGDKRPDDAKKRFETLLSKDPKNAQAYLALAQLAAAGNASPEEIGRLLTRAVEANPESPGPRALLVEHHLRNKDQKQALAVALSGAAAAPSSPEMLSLLARIQQLTGDLNQAISTYGKVVSLQPLSPMAHVRLAEAQVANKDTAAAEQSLRKALEIKPDMVEVQTMLVSLAVHNKNFSEAVKIAKTVQQQRPKAPIGFSMEGDAAAAQSNWNGALAAYRTGLKQSPDAEQLATKIHSVLMASRQAPEAERFAAGWIKDHPKDSAFLLYLGASALTRKDLATAEKSFAAVLQLDPNHPIALNNLAWVQGQLSKPGALAYAEKAVGLAPQQPAFMDTLAMLLAQKNELTRALELQSKVVELAPENHTFRLNLARILIQSGDRARAKTELESLARLGGKVAQQAEVTALLRGL